MQNNKQLWSTAVVLAKIVTVCLFFQFVIEIWFQYLNSQDRNYETRNKNQRNVFNVSKAFVITMKRNASLALLQNTKLFFDIDYVALFDAINGTKAITEAAHRLSIYTKYTLVMGRHDHLQLSTPAMLGCLLSHITIWEKVEPNQVVAVIEEDGYFDQSSRERILTLHKDLNYMPWDVIMLDSGQFISKGTWEYIGQAAVTCANQWWKNNSYPYALHESMQGNENQSISREIRDAFFTDPTYNLCTWFGTRGYLITFNGARTLLKHAFPIQVQVDALMGLVDAFEPDFKMFWTRQNIVHQNLFYITQIWDACIKCYLPNSTWFYIVSIIFLLSVLSALLYFCFGVMKKK